MWSRREAWFVVGCCTSCWKPCCWRHVEIFVWCSVKSSLKSPVITIFFLWRPGLDSSCWKSCVKCWIDIVLALLYIVIMMNSLCGVGAMVVARNSNFGIWILRIVDLMCGWINISIPPLSAPVILSLLYWMYCWIGWLPLCIISDSLRWVSVKHMMWQVDIFWSFLMSLICVRYPLTFKWHILIHSVADNVGIIGQLKVIALDCSLVISCSTCLSVLKAVLM